MIAFLTGRVMAVDAHSAVIDVGGVGLSALCTPATLAQLRVGETATVATSLVVREDSLTLYGFGTGEERTVFEALQTASGIGPRIALAALAVLTPQALRDAVASEDTATLTRIPGVGKKSAQRICLELRDKLGGGAVDAPSSSAGAPPTRAQAVEGLVNLGWSTRDAETAVKAAATEFADDAAPDTATLLRTALRKLSRA
ncbi:Holliday junction branch migration protein RuvA [Spiractinospora alimapuensis]|uniref:Holliday junction branch migration protein RuvA n=1 Tax=Spiractinospora alimapuensis TaxID=2820884 RepID=UPI001EEBB237|nr:Holliday junction branch migration protein RuvA [Spiractinospora alimapuensis]QVQ52054.1 Holliday junction branch migration protein RuvA [Spiractinospora alimapuensis]